MHTQSSLNIMPFNKQSSLNIMPFNKQSNLNIMPFNKQSNLNIMPFNKQSNLNIIPFNKTDTSSHCHSEQSLTSIYCYSICTQISYNTQLHLHIIPFKLQSNLNILPFSTVLFQSYSYGVIAVKYIENHANLSDIRFAIVLINFRLTWDRSYCHIIIILITDVIRILPMTMPSQIKCFIYYIIGAYRKTALCYIGPQLSYV